ncbi:MAG: phosphoribosylamine--glycine ligase [Bacteroidetes bacterium]|nr:phosphoribosylamine--glycine ligase [Bacteroidota bacterium]
MHILLLGSGGREHTLAWKLAQSDKCEQLHIAPGNAGTLLCGHNIAIEVDDFENIRHFVLSNKIDMVVVGPELPLVKGIQDYFLQDKDLSRIPLIGPEKAGALLEGSKAFAKEFMKRHRIPAAAFETFDGDSLSKGIAYINSVNGPYVLKADGLAAGKGVIICQTAEEAQKELRAMISNSKFGEAGRRVVIEEFLDGDEFSVFILTDGISYKILPTAKDYKRIGEGDTGLNTGGMGAISPVPFVDDELMTRVEKEIIIPTMRGLKKEKITYKGFLYFGLMVVNDDPYMIEYNVRLGDPETQVVLPRIKNDLVDLFIHVANETLGTQEIIYDRRAAATIVLTSEGYPEEYTKGKTIGGLKDVHDSIVFHAGTKIDHGNNRVTTGGRVIAITSYGQDLNMALELCIKNAGKIKYDGKYFRKDIGYDVVAQPEIV